jgi:hypothetical protein
MAHFPDPPIRKTREALAHYTQATGQEVPRGIWYEVAMKVYLNERFDHAKSGHHVFLTKWGSPEDRSAARDGIICMPDGYCFSVDFTSDLRRKKGALVFAVDTRWFCEEPPDTRVDAEKWMNEWEQVKDQIRKEFMEWHRAARRGMPRLPWPKGGEYD